MSMRKFLTACYKQAEQLPPQKILEALWQQEERAHARAKERDKDKDKDKETEIEKERKKRIKDREKKKKKKEVENEKRVPNEAIFADSSIESQSFVPSLRMQAS